MKIELKKIQFSESLSEETNAFTADVFVDGVKVAYARNSGHGGNTSVQPYPSQIDKFKELEQFCSKMEPVDDMEMDLEFYVDNLFEKWLVEKTISKTIKKFEKRTNTHLIIISNKVLNDLKSGKLEDVSYREIKFSVPDLKKVNPDQYKKMLSDLTPRLKGDEMFLNETI